jgi:uncharacterized protein (DUF1810 family)
VQKDLSRFVAAQEPQYGQVLDELRRGRKVRHWMWYIFPQLSGLGHSETSRFYGISTLDEAKAYLRHPVLGARLRECTDLVLSVPGRSLVEIFGSVDALKFRSSMTLFALATTDSALFRAALDKYCGGQPDPLTVELLKTAGSA